MEMTVLERAGEGEDEGDVVVLCCGRRSDCGGAG